MVRYLRTIVSEFRYDGSILRFRTVGRRKPQALRLTEIMSIREWKGRGGPVGYRLQSQDGEKLYLESSVSNSTTLVNLLRTHMYDGRED
jgi:hypothetical protein